MRLEYFSIKMPVARKVRKHLKKCLFLRLLKLLERKSSQLMNNDCNTKGQYHAHKEIQKLLTFSGQLI
ncbi:MAG: hypothetical protein CMF18_08490 [Idiomarinaceae bacterium]|nr:hypothetical protein [Idiomarinaceae bacterium]